MSRSNGKIHENFLIFATANSQRLHANKLSAAFLNRVLQVWLPPVDLQQAAAAAATASESQPALHIPTEAEVSQQMQWTSEQDVYGIVLSHFSDLPAGKELACMALRFHYEVQVSPGSPMINFLCLSCKHCTLQITFRCSLWPPEWDSLRHHSQAYRSRKFNISCKPPPSCCLMCMTVAQCYCVIHSTGFCWHQNNTAEAVQSMHLFDHQ